MGVVKLNFDGCFVGIIPRQLGNRETLRDHLGILVCTFAKNVERLVIEAET